MDKMAQGTPESEFSIECFRNYTAPEVFIQGLAGIVDQTDVESMIRAQKQMLQRFEKTNEMLTNCNALSASRLKTAGAEFKKHTQLLLDMKKDLDYIFKKIRAIKAKLSAQYPQAFAEALRNSLAEEANETDEECNDKTKESDNTNVDSEKPENNENKKASSVITEENKESKIENDQNKKYKNKLKNNSSSFDSSSSCDTV